jgi:hypothetical protein
MNSKEDHKMRKLLLLLPLLLMLAGSSTAVKPPFRVECCMGPGGYMYCFAPPNPYCEAGRIAPLDLDDRLE